MRVGFGIRDYFTRPFKVSLLGGALKRRDAPGGAVTAEMERIVEFTAAIADYMAEKHNAQIVFVPHHYLPEHERVIKPDTEIAEMVVRRLRVAKDVVVADNNLHPFTVINLYRQLDVVFSMRHHTNAFAYLNGVPTFGYAVYEKIINFFKQIGREDMLIDPFHADLPQLQRKIDAVIGTRQAIACALNEGLGRLRLQMAAALDEAFADGTGRRNP